MRILLLFVACSMFGQAMPNPKLTPGKTRPVTVHELCTTSTRAVRHTTPAMKKQVCLAYGIKSGCPGKAQEIDHLISLELGGADDVLNLWPEPYTPIPGAHQKDLVENRLHAMVCKGQISLADAQKAIATDWLGEYKKLGLAKPQATPPKLKGL